MTTTRRTALAVTAASIATMATGTLAQTQGVSTELVELMEAHRAAAARFEAVVTPLEAATEAWENDSKAQREALIDLGDGRKVQPAYISLTEMMNEINSAARSLRGNVSPAFMEQAESELNDRREMLKAAYEKHHEELLEARRAHHVTDIERQYDAAFDDATTAAQAVLAFPARTDADRAALAQWMRDYFSNRIVDPWEITAMIEGMAA